MIFAGLGGGGGSSRQGPREPIMTKEAMMEDLVKRSADSSSGSQASAVNSGTGGAEPVWQEAGGGFDIDLGKKFTSRQHTIEILDITRVCIKSMQTRKNPGNKAWFCHYYIKSLLHIFSAPKQVHL